MQKSAASLRIREIQIKTKWVTLCLIPFWLVFHNGLYSLIIFWCEIKRSFWVIPGVSLCTNKAPPAPFWTAVLCRFLICFPQWAVRPATWAHSTAERNMAGQTAGLWASSVSIFWMLVITQCYENWQPWCLIFWDGPHSVYGVCIFLNKTSFT